MKKFLALTAFAATLVLTGCGGADTPSIDPAESSAAATPSVEAAESEAPATAPTLEGIWKQVNSNSEDSYQQATITADTISIDWVSDGGNTTSIYWIGTFEAPAEGSGTITSVRDTAATDNALMASTDDTKDFTLDGETISYKLTALGTTMTVELQKN